VTVPFRFAPAKSAWLLLMAVPAVVFAPAAWSIDAAAAAVVLTTVTVVFGHTVGLHRGIIHRTYRMGRRTRAALAVLFALAGLGSPLAWLMIHYLRDHHQSRPDAPVTLRYDHDLGTDGWWTLFCAPVGVRWDELAIPSEDRHDPVLVALDRWWVPLQLVQAGALFAIGGWSWLVYGWFVRNTVVIVGHWFVGYLAHTAGWRRYRIAGASEEGRNLWLLGILSFGEGYHNNHHAAPGSARLGRHWSEVDVGWWAIVALEALGLVWGVARPAGPDDLLRPGAARAGDRVDAEPSGGVARPC
jgi:stearoyl-CoA desaturase (delta-9 desaturase)